MNVNITLKKAYLGYESSDDDNDETINSDNNSDIISDTPSCSPPHSCKSRNLRNMKDNKQTDDTGNVNSPTPPSTSPGVGHKHRNPPIFSENQTCFTPTATYVSNSPADFNIPLRSLNSVSSIEAPPFSPLTPLQAKKIIKSPASILTPMLPADSNELFTNTTSVSSIDMPLCSPITVRKLNTTSVDSPMPLMSPETKRLYEDLTESNILENSDDSVKDPDYIDNEACSDSDTDLTDCSTSIMASVDIHNECSTRTKNDTLKHQIANESKQMAKAVKKNVLLNNDEIIRDMECDNVETSNTNESKKDAQKLCSSVQSEEFIREEDISTESNTYQGRPKRGRKRKTICTRNEMKQKKYKNMAYFNRKNKKIESKKFVDYKCNCKNKCTEQVSREKREIEFFKYSTLGSFAAQLVFISSCIEENKKKRMYLNQNSSLNKKREFSRIYKIAGIKVCRDMFINTFQVSTQKVNTSLKKMRSGDEITDKRGDAVRGWNKIKDNDLQFVVNIIKKLPKYISQYSRKNTDAKYLAPTMTLPKIYEIYKTEFKAVPENENRKFVSFSTMKRIFYTKFNLRMKPLKKDTCNKCDAYAATSTTNSPDESILRLSEHNAHLDLAEGLRAQMKTDFQKAKIEKNTECLTFDLEKTLPLPRIPTNIVFYKRQLWVYNSGIHSASNDKGNCFVWVEGMAGRGAQEVGSCLIKYIKSQLPDAVEELILWSDSCGGQNRNIKLTLMMKAALHSHKTLKSISLRFLEPGHSFLPNDTDFSKIETRLKQHQRLYTVEDYVEVMKNCKKHNPLNVFQMNTEDFVGSKIMEKNIVNRKAFVNKNKVSWLRTKEILLKKNKEQSIFMRSRFDEEFQELDITKKGKIVDLQLKNLPLLWPQGKPIAQAKLEDLKSIMHLIPADCHKFYENLKGDSSVPDDVDGFGTPDFEIEFADLNLSDV